MYEARGRVDERAPFFVVVPVAVKHAPYTGTKHRLLFFPPVTTRFNSTRLDTTLARSNGSLEVPTLLFYFLKAGQKIRTDRVQDGCASKGRAATASYYYVISSRRWLLVRGSLEGKAAAPYIRTAWRPARRASAVSVRTAGRPARRASAVSDV